MLSPSTISISLLLVISQVCLGDNPFPVIPEVASSPKDCLHKAVKGTYCWYILRNKSQVNGGVRMLSNITSVKTFSSIELSTGFDNQSRPINVAVWTVGDVAYDWLLCANITLRISLHIPLFSETGSPIKGGWELNFPASLSATVTAPYLESATGANNAQATAVAYNNSIARLVLNAETLASDLATWYYEAYASIDVAGERERYSVHYNNPNLSIFSGSLSESP